MGLRGTLVGILTDAKLTQLMMGEPYTCWPHMLGLS